MRLESAYRIWRICYKNVKRCVCNLFFGILLQSVAKFDFSLPRAVHIQRHFGNTRKSVILFYAKNMMFAPSVFADSVGIVIRYKIIVYRFHCLGQEMTRATSIVNDFWKYKVFALTDNFIHWQTIPNKPRYRCWCKKLSFVLFKALVQKLLKQIAKKLMFRRIDDSVFLEQLNNFYQDLAVLKKQFFVVYVFESKIVVAVKFKDSDGIFQILYCCFALGVVEFLCEQIFCIIV